MLIGRGLIASQFKSLENDDSITIFASGVSNSKENENDSFEREFTLISEHVNNERLFVYFSTCSIYDPSLAKSFYVKHKLKVEEFIVNNFKNFLILRLPNIIGLTSNSHTFFNFFYDSISNNNQLIVQKNAIRYFMDAEDLLPILTTILSSNFKNNVINIAYNNPISIPSIIKFFEKEIKKAANILLIEEGSFYSIPNNYFIELYGKDVSLTYTQDCVEKYIKLKKSQNTL